MTSCLRALCLAAALGACAGEPPRRVADEPLHTRVEAHSPVAPRAPSSASSLAPAATPADLVAAALRPLGSLHRPLVVLNEPSEYVPRVYLAFVGPPDHVDAAWLAFDFAAEGRSLRASERAGIHLLRVEHWIPGVRIVDTTRSEALDEVFVLVESVDAASAPDATRGVVSFESGQLLTTGFGRYELARGGSWLEFGGVTSAEQLRAAVRRREESRAAMIEHARSPDAQVPTEVEERRRCRALVRALRTPRGWIEYVDPAGLDVARWMLDVVPGPSVHIARDSIAASSLVEPIRRRLLDDLERGASCHGRSASFVASETDVAGRPRIQRVIVENERAPEPPRRRGAFHPVAPAALPPEARAAFRANFEHEVVVVAAAPTDGGWVVAGTDSAQIGVMVWSGRFGTFQYVIGDPAVNPSLEVAFARREGDPRTAVVLRSRIETVEAEGSSNTPTWFHAIVVPGEHFEQLEAVSPEFDHAWWMVDAPDLAAAIRALENASVEPIPRAQACAVLARATDARTWRSVVTRDARRIDFEEPGIPTYGRAVPLGRIARVDCREITCSREAPRCGTGEGLSERDYWFRREGGRWQLAGVAIYSGS